jgi:uncharacterized membrane protein YgcG
MEQLSHAGTDFIDPLRLQGYMTQILSALAFCHDRRIIHRDMKPDNILLDESRRMLKIADFGMARTFIPNNAYTERCVTVWYRPPEIILGDSRYGPPVDMWSVGCILAEMITLAPIFRCNTEIECLLHMFRNLGTPDETSWPGVSALPNFQPSFPRWLPQPPAALLNGEGAEAAAAAAAAGPHCLALLGRLLQLRPESRIKAREALDHPFFREPLDAPPPGAAAAADAPPEGDGGTSSGGEGGGSGGSGGEGSGGGGGATAGDGGGGVDPSAGAAVPPPEDARTAASGGGDGGGSAPALRAPAGWRQLRSRPPDDDEPRPGPGKRRRASAVDAHEPAAGGGGAGGRPATRAGPAPARSGGGKE